MAAYIPIIYYTIYYYYYHYWFSVTDCGIYRSQLLLSELFREVLRYMVRMKYDDKPRMTALCPGNRIHWAGFCALESILFGGQQTQSVYYDASRV